MRDGNHNHEKNNPNGLHKHKKLIVFGVMAVLIAIASYELAQTPIVYQTVVNNTNLAPTIHVGIPGTGERLNDTTYYANTSEIDLHVFAHADSVAQVASTFVYINDTLVCARSGRPLGIAESAYRGCDLTIPKYSYYRVNFTNFHHYEWREYPKIAGRNGTAQINQYTNQTYINQTGNQTNVFDTIFVNNISKNDTSVNNTIIIDGNFKTTGEFHIYNSFQNCDFLLNGELFVTCTNASNPNNGTILTVGIDTISLDYADDTNATHVGLDTYGVHIECPNGSGAACIQGFSENTTHLNIGNQTVNTSKALNTVYRNERDIPIFVSVVTSGGASGTDPACLSDGSNPPTTIVNKDYTGTSGGVASITCMVISKNYYKVATTLPSVTITNWVEYS